MDLFGSVVFAYGVIGGAILFCKFKHKIIELVAGSETIAIVFTIISLALGYYVANNYFYMLENIFYWVFR